MSKIIQKLAAAILLGSLSFSILAQEGASVVAVVSPAWVVQGEDRIPLKPGYQVSASDLIETADEGRVQFAFSNNAEFQLGEKARFKAHRLKKPVQPDEPYDGFVEVLEGAFRYIGEVFGPKPRESQFRVRVGLATVGLRGTDFWGVTDGKTDTIVLIDGAISITPETGAPLELTEPLSLVQNVAGIGTGPVSQVNMDLLLQSAAQTSLPDGQGVMTLDGQYAVILGSFNDEANAKTLEENLITLGYPATVEFSATSLTYRVQLANFASLEDAIYFSEQAYDRFDILGAWVKYGG